MRFKNLLTNWQGVLIALFFLAVGALSLIDPHTFDDIVLRRGGWLKLVAWLWGWPVGIASTLFGLLILLGCTANSDDDEE